MRELESSSSQARVLIVEDEPDLRELYAEWLADDYQVATAEDGPSALETLDDSFDVVLLDRKLPEMKGEELIPAIQRLTEQCRIAMVTSVEAEWETLKMDFDAYLTKPVRQDDLCVLVDALVDGNYEAIARRSGITL